MKKSMAGLVLVGMGLFLISGLNPQWAQKEKNIWGPKVFTREKAKPITIKEEFPWGKPGTGYNLRLVNGANTGIKTSAATIKLNNREIIAEKDLNKNVKEIIRAIDLEAANKLEITLLGQPGSSFSLQVYQIVYDMDPPEITTNPTTGAYVNQPEINITGKISDESAILYLRINGIPVSIEGENFTFSHEMRLAGEGENEIQLESSDIYENIAIHPLVINFDGTQPKITIIEPSGLYSPTPVVPVIFEIEDISPVTATLNGSPVSVIAGQVETTLTLAENLEHAIEIKAEDAAGNTAAAEKTVIIDTICPTLKISNPNNAVTNRERIVISGVIEDKNPALIKLKNMKTNENKEGEIIGNQFYIRDVLLAENRNDFEFLVEDYAANSNQTPYNLTVIGDRKPPQLTVINPEPGKLTPRRSILVIARGEDEHLQEAKINGIACPLAAGNEFSREVQLSRKGKFHSNHAARQRRQCYGKYDPGGSGFYRPGIENRRTGAGSNIKHPNNRYPGNL